ncbi:MAG: NUDIX hydrolase [Dehalococcoidia bacterium]|nr:NUDIX hydrolase [Dehalococcoidia bacterium]
MKPEKHSVALVIHDASHPGLVLTVLRPPDDDELPNIWGLPAGSLKPGETVQTAAIRVGRQKLGVTLAVEGPIALGQQERPDYLLTMTLLQARITAGKDAGMPATHSMNNKNAGITLYAALRWALADALEEGSLCCQLYLQHHRATR